MMYNFGSQYCPRCQSEIDSENVLGATAICSQCGWSPDKNEVVHHNETQKKIVQIFVVTSILMIIVYFFTVKWDQYSLSVVGYKIQGIFGAKSTQTLSAMSEICKDRKLYTCSVEQLQDLTRAQPQNLEAIAQLATLLHRTNRESEAIQAYSNYFSNNGDNKDLAFQFAKLLEKQGHLEKALEYYKFVIEKDPEVFETTAIQNYAKLLIKGGMQKEAELFIKAVRKRGENFPKFMEEELKVLSQQARR